MYIEEIADDKKITVDAKVTNFNESPDDLTVEDAKRVSEMRKQLREKIVTNVYEESEFKEQFCLVFKKISDILVHTLGPYGSSTLIDRGTSFAKTKDGFHVLQNIRFADPKQNRIYANLYGISHNMVMQVGDGSTSSVIAAYHFMNQMLTFMKDNKNVRPKVLDERIRCLVEDICNIIATNAKIPDPNNLSWVISRVANIASNDNRKYTQMITEIYEKMGSSVSIDIKESPTSEDNVIYSDGRYFSQTSLVNSIYHNDGGNKCVLKDCDVLIFDHVVDNNFVPIVGEAFKHCYKNAHTLIIIAPDYNQNMMDYIRNQNEQFRALYKNTYKVPWTMVYCRAMMVHKVEQDMFMDLASLLGATIYRHADTQKWIEGFDNYTREVQKAKSKWEEDLRDAKDNDLEPPQFNAPKIPEEMQEDVIHHMGFCESVELGDKESSFAGFINKNESMYNIMLHDAETTMKMEEERAVKNDAVDNKVFDARNRYSKLLCKNATIEVGGTHQLEKSLNMDMVDDAVKAVSSALKYGYNQGCNLAIIQAIDSYMKDTIKHPDISILDYNILMGLRKAFLRVYKEILMNGKSEEAAEAIVQDSCECYLPYNLANDSIDKSGSVINPCRTDIEILRGAIAMVGLVLTCNQYISSTLKI